MKSEKEIWWVKERVKGDEEREREASYNNEERGREGNWESGKEGGKLRGWEGGRKIERVRRREENWEGGKSRERERGWKIEIGREELRVGEVNINSNLCGERGSGCEQSEGWSLSMIWCNSCRNYQLSTSRNCTWFHREFLVLCWVVALYCVFLYCDVCSFILLWGHDDLTHYRMTESWNSYDIPMPK